MLFRLIPERGPAAENPGSVKKLIFCTGRVYYEMSKARKERKLENDIAIARVEQVNFVFYLSNIKIFKPNSLNFLVKLFCDLKDASF